MGEVHAMVGENGARNSTLMLILGDINLLEEGEINLEGGEDLFAFTLHDDIKEKRNYCYCNN